MHIIIELAPTYLQQKSLISIHSMLLTFFNNCAMNLNFFCPGQGFADIQKKRILNQYSKVVRRESKKFSDWTEKLQKIYNEELVGDELQTSPSKKKQKVGNQPAPDRTEAWLSEFCLLCKNIASLVLHVFVM